MASKTDIKRGIKTRMRTLFVLEYLNRYVGKVVSAADIMDAFLDKYPLDYKEDSISMNKYIYDDVHSLIEFGYDVEILRGHGIRMNTRKDGMTPMEIELIEMAINSSPMLAKRDKKALRYRITGSIGDKVSGRTIADNIEWIKEAIGMRDRKGCPIHPKVISFDYLIQEETVRMEYVTVLPRKSLEVRTVPMAIFLPDTTHIYATLLGVDLEKKKLISYRIDRISKIRIVGDYDSAMLDAILTREEAKAAAAKEKPIKIRVEILKPLLGWFIDHYGKPNTQNNSPDNDEAVIAEYYLAPKQMKKLFDFISENKVVKIVGTPTAKEHYREYLRAKIQRYSDMIDEYK